jgi:hypothetical protein
MEPSYVLTEEPAFTDTVALLPEGSPSGGYRAIIRDGTVKFNI